MSLKNNSPFPGLYKPPNNFPSVDLPEPEEPTIPTFHPGSKEMFMFFSKNEKLVESYSTTTS